MQNQKDRNSAEKRDDGNKDDCGSTPPPPPVVWNLMVCKCFPDRGRCFAALLPYSSIRGLVGYLRRVCGLTTLSRKVRETLACRVALDACRVALDARLYNIQSGQETRENARSFVRTHFFHLPPSRIEKTDVVFSKPPPTRNLELSANLKSPSSCSTWPRFFRRCRFPTSRGSIRTFRSTQRSGISCT